MRREWTLLEEEAGAVDILLDGDTICCVKPSLAQFIVDACNAAEQRKEWSDYEIVKIDKPHPFEYVKH